MDDGHAGTLARVAADRRVDGALVRRLAPDQREVGALDGPGGQLAHEVGLRGKRTGDDHQARGFLVQPMHDTGARQLARGRVAVQQAVEHRTAPVTGGRMHDQPGRLVDDEQRGVLEHHVQRHVLRREGEGLRRNLRLDLDLLAHLDRSLGAARLAIHPHGAFLDPLLDAAAREFTEMPREQFVEPLAM
ncbi:hypothetical protein D3C72_1859110 [compost metagenome]